MKHLQNKAALAFPPLAIAFVWGAVSLSPDSGPQPEPQPLVQKGFTYAEDIAPLLNNHCIQCHRPGEVAPFSLIGYENAKQWSAMMAQVTESGQMPPWKAEPADVEYKNNFGLTNEQRKMLKAWDEAGAPRGDRSKEPAPPTFGKDWALGDPDLLLQMPYEFELKADGQDEYWNFVIKPDIKEPVWVQAMDVRPGNKKIVHHVIAFTDKKGRSEKLLSGPRGDKKAGYLTTGGGVGFMPDGSMGGWAPGVAASKLPDDAGFLLEPGTDIILQVHYNKSGKIEKDRTQVALYFNKSAKAEKKVDIAWIANPLINIKAGAANAKFTQRFRLPTAIEIYNVMPHMHLLGRSMTAHAVFPDGKKIKLVDVQDWDFNWQLVYTLKKPMILPAGTELVVEASYDNSKDNPFQPNDPPKDVRWGEETTDEMMLLVAAYSVVK